MKKALALFVVLSLALFAGSAFAGQARNNTGCGLGSMLFEDNADGSVFSQSLQATTNGIFGNQTFGITSGTLGCEQPDSVFTNDMLLAFTVDNMDGLARDISAGHGETLTTVAELMEIPADHHDAFFTKLQSNFDKIFVTGEESASVVLNRMAKIAG
ncbi:MAG: DUF3015 domain-containing protein [Desulfuromonadales bacterium]|nr:DUF3015 domain-containing protein [Desulfuromonadales bacterium]